MRRALIDVYVSVTLGALAAATAIYALALPPLIITIVIIYLGYNLMILVVPWSMINRQLARSKRDLKREVLDELRAICTKTVIGTARDVEIVWIEQKRVDELPDRVIRRVPLGVLVALYLIPIIGIIPAYRR